MLSHFKIGGFVPLYNRRFCLIFEIGDFVSFSKSAILSHFRNRRLSHFRNRRFCLIFEIGGFVSFKIGCFVLAPFSICEDLLEFQHFLYPNRPYTSYTSKTNDLIDLSLSMPKCYNFAKCCRSKGATGCLFQKWLSALWRSWWKRKNGHSSQKRL